MEMSCQTNQHRNKQSPGLHVFLNCFFSWFLFVSLLSCVDRVVMRGGCFAPLSLFLCFGGRGIKSPGMGEGLLLPLGVLSHKRWWIEQAANVAVLSGGLTGFLCNPWERTTPCQFYFLLLSLAASLLTG